MAGILQPGRAPTWTRPPATGRIAPAGLPGPPRPMATPGVPVLTAGHPGGIADPRDTTVREAPRTGVTRPAGPAGGARAPTAAAEAAAGLLAATAAAAEAAAGHREVSAAAAAVAGLQAVCEAAAAAAGPQEGVLPGVAAGAGAADAAAYNDHPLFIIKKHHQ